MALHRCDWFADMRVTRQPGVTSMNVLGGADLAWYLQQPSDPFTRNQSLHSLQHVTVLEAMHTTQHVETLEEPCCS